MEYASKCNIPLIPVYLEKNIKIAGWLGFIIASLPSFHLVDPDTYDEQLEELLRLLATCGRTAKSVSKGNSLSTLALSQLIY